MLRPLSIPLGLMLALLADGIGGAQAQSQPTPPTREPATQNTPAPTLPPSQMPPSAPRISYAGGFLTVVANNATLDEVLVGIGKAIGANIQGIQSESPERVFGQFGPASPCQVLDTLLIGSRYDFILLGSAGRVGSVREIILSPSAAETNQSALVTPVQPSMQSPVENNPPAVVSNEQPPTDIAPEERAGFRRNRRGPGAREIVRPQPLPPNGSTTTPPPVPNL
ncbi:MAG TPA: hypothetical protein VHA33_27275 [Candidatus Angelobacter sp.]|jgi:hypothetical protein|nr:hypothetical protein [Candidatus Angelobacter sp.]